MTTFVERIEQLYNEQPDRTAIVLQHSGQVDQPITYRQLVRGASAYANTLAREKVLPGEVVVLILQHGMDLVYAFWGAILQGSIPSIMPYLTEKLAPEQYRADLAALIAVTQPAGVITYPQFEAEVRLATEGGSPVRSIIVTNQLAAESEAARALGVRGLFIFCSR